jgi:hypothetical protein
LLTQHQYQQKNKRNHDAPLYITSTDNLTATTI